MTDEQVALSPEGWVAEQTRTILENGTTEGASTSGRPIVLLTVRGAKSGTLRYTPLMRVEHDGSYAAVASLGGAPRHPVWYHNLRANREVRLQDGRVTRSYHARELSGDERAAWWDRAVATFPAYAEYQARTEREIPVFVLDPVD